MGKIMTQRQDVQLVTQLESKETKIIFMINLCRYFPDYVFVVFEEYGYRLIVNRSGEVVTDEIYETLNGAKIAFHKFHRSLAFYDDEKPIWSHEYGADKEWVEKRIKRESI